MSGINLTKGQNINLSKEVDAILYTYGVEI
jgi:hypothetical protein